MITLDYTESGTCAAGGFGTEVEEPRGGFSDTTHSHMADSSRVETSDTSSKSISEAVNSGGGTGDIADLDGRNLRNPKILFI